MRSADTPARGLTCTGPTFRADHVKRMPRQRSEPGVTCTAQRNVWIAAHGDVCVHWTGGGKEGSVQICTDRALASAPVRAVIGTRTGSESRVPAISPQGGKQRGLESSRAVNQQAWVRGARSLSVSHLHLASACSTR